MDIFWLMYNTSFYQIPLKFGLWIHYSYLPNEFKFQNFVIYLYIGAFGLPSKMVTMVVTKVIKDYFDENDHSGIKQIYLCDLNSDVTDFYTKHLERHFGENVTITPTENIKRTRRSFPDQETRQNEGKSKYSLIRDFFF